MIKIIERHEPKEFEPKYKFTCSKCHSVAIITEDEIKYHSSGYNEDCVKFKCPVCKEDYYSSSVHNILSRTEFKEYKVR